MDVSSLPSRLDKFAAFQASRHYQAPAPPSSSSAEGTLGPRSDAAAEAALSTRTQSILTSSSSSRCVVVSGRQKGNPVLKCIRKVPWEYGAIVPDFRVGDFAAVLFLSLKYHNLHPGYLGLRMEEMGREYALRVLLVLVDVEDTNESLTHLADVCVGQDYSLVLAWSFVEAGRYIETLKAYQHKDAKAIMARSETDYFSVLSDTLTSVRTLNKNDASALSSAFGSVANILTASQEQLAVVPGLGARKVLDLHDILNRPFKRGSTHPSSSSSSHPSSHQSSHPSSDPNPHSPTSLPQPPQPPQPPTLQ